VTNGVSVAEDMALTLVIFAVGFGGEATTTANLTNQMNTVLSQAVFTIPSGAATGQGFINLGILPGYVQAFGPDGARLFELKNR